MLYLTYKSKTIDIIYVQNVFPVYTNIVVFEIPLDINYNDIIKRLSEQGIKTVPFGPQQIRLVTHLDFTDLMLDRTIEVLKKLSVKGKKKNC